jgi:flagellar protein FlgJ
MESLLGVVTGQIVQAGAATAQDVVAAQSAGRQFEALLVTTLLKEMRRSIPQGGLLPRSESTGIYEEMLDARLAEQLSQRQDPGLAAAVYRMMAGHGAAKK